MRVARRGLRRAAEGPATASAPLSAGLGGAALALRSCGRAVNGLRLTQPSSAPAAAEAAERFQTCSVPGPARVDDTKSQHRRGRPKGAAELLLLARVYHAGGWGRGAPLKIDPVEA